MNAKNIAIVVLALLAVGMAAWIYMDWDARHAPKAEAPAS